MTAPRKQPAQALADVKVLELGENITAPFAARLLADLGAEVVKVEPPQGDESRVLGPFPQDQPHPEKSGTFLYLNANKLGVTLDARTPPGRRMVLDLARQSDVLIENYPPGYLASLGLGYNTFQKLNPRLTVTSITTFGQWGPYANHRAYHLQTWHAAGVGRRFLGDPDRAPLTGPNYFAEYFAGINGAAASLISLHAREVIGKGQRVDISVADTLAIFMLGYQLVALYFDRKHTRTRHGTTHPSGAPGATMPCKDGYVFVLAADTYSWDGMAKAMGDPEWMKSPIFQVPFQNRFIYADEIHEMIKPWLLEHTKEEILQLHQANRALSTPVYDMKELLEHPHLAERRFFVEMTHPVAGAWKVPGAPYKLSKTPWRLAHPAPLLGQHNDEVLCKRLGYSKAEVEQATTPRPGRQTLSYVPSAPAHAQVQEPGQQRAVFPDLRVVNLGWFWAGPLVGTLLADMGAQVIKVESSARPDNTRTNGGRLKDKEGQAFYAHTLLRNYRSLALDLNKPEAQEVARRLIAQSDIVVENYRPGTVTRWRLDYETLRKVKPDLIMVSLSSAGQTGPMRHVGTIGYTLATLSGIDGMQGYEGEGPMPNSQATLDPFNGVQATLAVLAALRHRDRTGEGQYIDMSLWEAASSYLGVPMLEYQMTGRIPGRRGNHDPYMAPHNVYPCQGRDAWVAIAVKTDAEWQSLCRAIDRPDWAHDERLAHREGRLRHQRELDEGVAAWTRQREPRAAAEVLQRAGVAAMPCHSDAEAYTDPHFNARDAWVEVQHPVGKETIYGIHWKFSETPGAIRTPCPDLGQDNHYLLEQVLGLSSAETSRLVEQRIAV